MKTAFLLAAATAVTAQGFANSEDGFAQWALHNNEEFTIEETFQRFHIWKGNYDIVTKHNSEADAGLHTFRLGMNSLAALSHEEYKAKLSYRHNATKTAPVDVFDPSPSTVGAAPASKDWRKARSPKLVSPIKNQKDCGSCWAFSAVEAMESAAAVHTNSTVQIGAPQQLVDCVRHGKDTCNVGGEMHDGYLEVIKEGGLDTEASYPYKARSWRHCKFKPDSVIKGTESFKGYKQIKVGSEKALLAASAAIPTISIGMDASSNKFQLYKSGVYNVPNCKNDPDDLDHGVAIVGYGTDKGKAYWLVKNSWGLDWGKLGYILMSKDDKNQCGVASDATYPTY